MIIYEVELLAPEAQVLLEEMAKKNLIRFKKPEEKKTAFWETVERIRQKAEAENIPSEEITRVVEEVRTIRYGK